MDFLPKIKVETVVADHQKDAAVAAIIKAAKTGKIGDGKVFISTIEEATRIRTDEKGDQAVLTFSFEPRDFGGVTGAEIGKLKFVFQFRAQLRVARALVRRAAFSQGFRIGQNRWRHGAI